MNRVAKLRTERLKAAQHHAAIFASLVEKLLAASVKNNAGHIDVGITWAMARTDLTHLNQLLHEANAFNVALEDVPTPVSKRRRK